MPEIDRFMDALHKWCKKHKGRQKVLAAELGVTEQVLSHWLCRRKMPSFAFGMKLQAYAREKGVVTEEQKNTGGSSPREAGEELPPDSAVTIPKFS